jgi:hypothetical protein
LVGQHLKIVAVERIQNLLRSYRTPMIFCGKSSNIHPGFWCKKHRPEQCRHQWSSGVRPPFVDHFPREMAQKPGQWKIGPPKSDNRQ